MAMTKQVAYERSLANLPRTYKVDHSCRSECIFELRYEMPWQVLFCDTHRLVFYFARCLLEVTLIGYYNLRYLVVRFPTNWQL